MKQLKRDPEKKFNPEFVRTTDLERRLIDQYGFEGIRLIFEDRDSANYFPLGDFPEGCPWVDLNKKDVEGAIDTVFAPIKDKIPNLIRSMKERCRFIYAAQAEGTWVLHYLLDMKLYDGRDYYLVYTGGAPTPDPAVNSSLGAYEWDITKDLRSLYAIHDGFGPVLGSDDISIMAEMMDPITKEQGSYPDGYHFRDLLEFHPDGSGNAQCFQRAGSDLTTVDWDHETWELSGEMGFFEYIDYRLSELDEK